jgi:hypothetical protein
MDTVKIQVIKKQKEGKEADPLWKKEFLELLETKRNLTPLELRLVATICAFMRDMKV